MSQPLDEETLTDLTRQWHELDERFRVVGTRVEEAGRALLRGDRPPDSSLLDDVQQLRQAYLQLWGLYGEASGNGTGEPPPLNRLGDLIRELVESRSWEGERQMLLDVLEGVGRIAHAKQPNFQPLHDCLTKARSVAGKIAALTPASGRAGLQTALQNVQPFADLCEFLGNRDGMSDEQCEQYLDRIEKAFGKPLSFAAAMGRLVLEGPPPSKPPPEPSHVPPATGGEAGGITLASPAPAEAEPDPLALAAARAAFVVPTEPSPPSTDPSASEEVLTDGADVEPDVRSGEIHEPVARFAMHDDEPEAPATELVATVAREVLEAMASRTNGMPGSHTGSPAVEPAPVPAIVEPEPDPGFDPSTATELIAASIRSRRLRDRQAATGGLIWRLAADRRSGLASHLAATLNRIESHPARPPAALWRALALAPQVRLPSGELADGYRAAIERLMPLAQSLQHAVGERAVCLKWLLTAAALRPALVAPATGCADLLVGPSACGSATDELRSAIHEFARHHIALSPSLCRGTPTASEWTERSSQLRKDVAGWLVKAGRAPLEGPALAIWSAWLTETGPLGSWLTALTADDRSRVSEITTVLGAWESVSDIEGLIDRADEERRGRRASFRPLDAVSRSAIRRLTQEAAYLIRRWLMLMLEEPTEANISRLRAAESIRERLRSLLAPVGEELQGFLKAGGQSMFVMSTATVVRHAIDDLARWLDPQSLDPERFVPLRVALNEELLGLVNFPLNDDWLPEDVSSDRLLEGLLSLAEVAPLVQKSPELARLKWAFSRQADARNHRVTAWIVDVVSVRAPDEVTAMQARRDRAVRQCIEELDRRTVDARLAVEAAVCAELLTALDREELLAEIAAAQSFAPDFAAAFARLESVESALTQRRARRVKDVQTEAASVAATDPQTYARVQEFLARGDFIAAARLVKGEGLVEDRPSRDPLSEFFPMFVRKLEERLDDALQERPSVRVVIADIRRGKPFGPVHMHDVPPVQAESAAKMLEAWFKLKNRVGDPREGLRELLAGFGFAVRDLRPGEAGTPPHWLYEVRVTPVTDRSICTSPRFGSLAGGRYRILGVFDRPSLEEVAALARRLDTSGRSGAVLVLYLGRMLEAAWRELARLSRQDARSFLTIDESLIFFLCNEKGNRLSALFGCTLPFTSADLYNESGPVPAELFVGRDRERDDLQRPGGSHFLVGAPKTGRSALLREMERRYCDPVGRMARRLTIDGDFWTAAGRILLELGVAGELATNAELLSSRVHAWLCDPYRRLALLIDDADPLISQDARQGYPILSWLDRLIGELGGRFKVIFAGGSEVLRAARDPLCPIASNPLILGPLLEESGWQDAQELLVNAPRQAGYRYESLKLPLRMVAAADYEPALIQTLGRLTLALNETDEPPRLITEQHVDTALASDDWHRILTAHSGTALSLDPRYRLLALSLAGRSKGATIDQLRNESLDVWPDAFGGEDGLDTVHWLAEEMTALGALRRTRTGGYTLTSRTTSVVPTSDEAIAVTIHELMTHGPGPADLLSHRVSTSDPIRPGPIPARQLAAFRQPGWSVGIRFGSPVGGFDELLLALRTALPDGAIMVLDGLQHVEELKARLGERAEASDAALTVIPAEAPWNVDWVKAASEMIGPEVQGGAATGAVLFLADPVQSWHWGEQPLSGVREFWQRPLTMSATEVWLTRLGYDAEAAPAFLQATDGWPILLEAAALACGEVADDWAERLFVHAQSWHETPEWAGAFAPVAEALPVLRLLLEAGNEAEESELVTRFGASRDELSRALRWADRLGYARPVGRGRWRLDASLSRVLATGVR